MPFRKKKEPNQENEIIEVPNTEIVDIDNPEQGIAQPVQQEQVQQLEQQPMIQQPQPVAEYSEYSPSEQTVQQRSPLNQPVQPIGSARIVSGELVEKEGNSFFRYIVLTNKSLGKIGEEFPIE